jgi:hypothetical protein
LSRTFVIVASSVPDGAMQEVQQVHNAENSDQPEEIVQVPLVQVVGDPPWFFFIKSLSQLLLKAKTGSKNWGQPVLPYKFN